METTGSIQKNSAKIKICYPKSRLQNQLGYGIIMLGVGIFAVYINSSSIFSYLWILIGGLQLGTSIYQKKHQYLTIEADRLIKHSLFPKSIKVSQIKRVRKYRNSYKIETGDRSLLIEKNFIEENSLRELNDFIESLRPRVATQLPAS